MILGLTQPERTEFEQWMEQLNPPYISLNGTRYYGMTEDEAHREELERLREISNSASPILLKSKMDWVGVGIGLMIAIGVMLALELAERAWRG